MRNFRDDQDIVDAVASRRAGAFASLFQDVVQVAHARHAARAASRK